MKKPAFTASAILLCALMLASCTDKKKRFKNELTKECIEGGDKQFTDPKIRAHFHEYCECSAGKISEKISREEFAKMKAEGRSAEVQGRILPIIEPCLNELQAKMDSPK